jgi:homoserine/homoserine lactone efflux protein
MGAGYLVYLGVRTLWHAGKQDHEAGADARPYRQAVFTQLSNPKAMLYFGSFLPQFLDLRAPLWPQYGEMFVVICIGETLILGCYGFLASRGAQMAGARFRLWRDRISGAIFIAIGAMFAAARRA